MYLEEHDLRLPDEIDSDNLDDLISINEMRTSEDVDYKEAVLELLLDKYQPYIRSIASKYQWILDMDDLMQEGRLGLLDAIKKFNLDKNVKFKTYATPWIKKRMLRAIENTSSLIRVPVYIQQINRHIRKIQQEDPDITKEALAEKLNVTPNQIGYALNIQKQVLLDFDVISNRYDPSDMEKLVREDDALQAIFDAMDEIWKVILHERYERLKKSSYKALSAKLRLSIRKVKEIELDMKEWLYNAYYDLLYKSD